MKFILDVPELKWTNICQMYLDGLTIENIKLRSKMFFGLVIQKLYLNEIQRSILYNAICDQIEMGCDKMQIVCHTTILEFAVLHPEEIKLLVKERFLLKAGKLHANYKGYELIFVNGSKSYMLFNYFR